MRWPIIFLAVIFLVSAAPNWDDDYHYNDLDHQYRDHYGDYNDYDIFNYKNTNSDESSENYREVDKDIKSSKEGDNKGDQIYKEVTIASTSTAAYSDVEVSRFTEENDNLEATTSQNTDNSEYSSWEIIKNSTTVENTEDNEYDTSDEAENSTRTIVKWNATYDDNDWTSAAEICKSSLVIVITFTAIIPIYNLIH